VQDAEELPAPEEEYEMTEAEYRLMLLEHWKERVAGGSEGMPEHDMGLGMKARAAQRKKRRLGGILHPMFDTAPSTFPCSSEHYGADEHGEWDDDDEGLTPEPSALAQPVVGSKKSRSGKPVARRELMVGSAGMMPFGDGPLAVERRQAWAATMKQVGPKHRDLFKVLQNQQMDAKKCVQMCQKRYRKDALASLKVQRDFMVRARKVSKEVGTIWRRENAKALAAAGMLDSSSLVSADVSRSRKEAREALERKKMEEAERERIRQQKRINFLLTQTELFAHFIGQKMEGITDTGGPAAQAPESAPAVAPVVAQGTASGLTSKDAERIAREKKKGELDKTETREALASAQAALQNRQRIMNAFDEETREAGKKLSKKNDQALVNSLDDAALQHKDVNLTAEAASIFIGTLKGYQKIGTLFLLCVCARARARARAMTGERERTSCV
jgi:hypothetical protein